MKETLNELMTAIIKLTLLVGMEDKEKSLTWCNTDNGWVISVTDTIHDMELTIIQGSVEIFDLRLGYMVDRLPFSDIENAYTIFTRQCFTIDDDYDV